MIRDKIRVFRDKITGDALAYNRVFEKQSPYVLHVLKDLAKFCRAHGSTFHPDPRMHAVLEGRREVWLKIQENLNLTIEEIYRLHTVKEIYPKEDKT